MVAQLFPLRQIRLASMVLACGAIATLGAGMMPSARAGTIIINGQQRTSQGGIVVDLERSYIHTRFGDRYRVPIRISEPRTTVRVIQRYPSSHYGRPSQVILDSTLVNPTIIDSQIINSTLIDPVIIDTERTTRYRYREPRRISIPMNSDLPNCIELDNLQRACYRY